MTTETVELGRPIKGPTAFGDDPVAIWTNPAGTGS